MKIAKANAGMTRMNSAKNEYTFSYVFSGRKWSASVWADSPEEAKRKIRAQAAAVYDGEVVMKLPLPVKASWLNRLINWIKNHG